MVMETYDNSGHFDLTFISFVWVAFLPTLSTPALYASWKISRSTKERLQSRLHPCCCQGGRGLPVVQARAPFSHNNLYQCHQQRQGSLHYMPAPLDPPVSPRPHHLPHRLVS
ncbi:hypothetical protein Pmani_027440 [Petrolisthes manimaculis]|uniref:Uncharacterized protein n=1 Tax=Petrolisthes manimaculis TaxID=1843537 RepID=A0AAE1P1E7_9EUCA|nr:hypothetical protein Pmani_027440 [Petrolisthes manimaculis]